MRARILTIAVVCTVAALGGLAMTQASRHLNPVVELLAQKKPVFSLYAPANRGAGGGRGRGTDTANRPPQPPPPPQKTPAELALESLAYKGADAIFSGDMERATSFDAAYERFAVFTKGMADGGVLQKSPARISQPLFVKTPKISTDPAKAAERISRQLNLGVSGIAFVEVESADELKQGLAMMRFKSKGGIRPDDVGTAPALWGMTEKEYKEKADVWPLNQNGELVNWTIVETKEGLAHIREIAAVKGIGALIPGAGSLRQVMTTTDSAGRRVTDTVAWEAAIQQVLAACKEFKVPCGYPAVEADIEMRMKQGFTVFIIAWGEAGFRTVDVGRKVAQ